jgi:hypothetical protein
MVTDLLTLQPTVVSRDLKGKFICIYGLPKTGKTSLSAQFPKNLLFGFEHGWNALGGIKAVDITKWSDFKAYLRQLEKPEIREAYDTITIDTVGIAWDLCEQFVCAQNSVQKISEIPWGGGYSACKKEFETCLRKITQLGYGLVIIAHVDKRIEKRGDDEDVEILGPSIPKRAYEIVNQLVDIIGYIEVQWDENGNSKRYLYTRKTPTIMAGSRFKYLAEKIPFGYNELVTAINKAIDEAQAKDGITVIDKALPIAPQEQERSYDEVKAEAFELWKKLVPDNGPVGTDNMNKILKKAEIIFGKKIKLSEINEDQLDLFEQVVEEMKKLL